MRLFAVAFLFSVAVASPAVAQDRSAKSFQGLSATAIVGIDDLHANGRDGTGVVYGGQIGYDWQSGNTVFGIEGEVAGASSRYCYSAAVVAGDRFCDKADRDLYAGGRLGKIVGDNTLLYVKAGYTNLRDKFDYRDARSSTANYSGSAVLDGIRGGVGIEHRLGSNVQVKAEYRYSDYENQYSRHQGIVGLGFRF